MTLIADLFILRGYDVMYRIIFAIRVWKWRRCNKVSRVDKYVGGAAVPRAILGFIDGAAAGI
ncbi:MAG TPA: hypothetical protein EYP33_07940 [Pyrodictium sp.]|nr:hypothetical protein [Pyrodictium sp.]